MKHVILSLIYIVIICFSLYTFYECVKKHDETEKGKILLRVRGGF